MNVISIPERGIRKEVPASFDEMTPRQVQYVFRLYDDMHSSGGSADDFNARLIIYLLDLKISMKTIRRSYMKRWMPLLFRDAAKVSLIVDRLVYLQEELLGFVLVEEQGAMALNYKSVHQHLPEMKVGRRCYYGPDSLLTNITFCEFRAAVEELAEYFETRDEHTLSRAIATLWRPERKDYRKVSKLDAFDGRRCQPYNPALTEKIACEMDKAPAWQRLQILLWLSNCVNYIQTQDIEIGPYKVNFSPLFGSKKSVSSGGIGWAGVVFSIAENGILGKVKEVEESNLFEVLLLLYNEHLKERDRKK